MVKNIQGIWDFLLAIFCREIFYHCSCVAIFWMCQIWRSNTVFYFKAFQRCVFFLGICNKLVSIFTLRNFVKRELFWFSVICIKSWSAQKGVVFNFNENMFLLNIPYMGDLLVNVPLAWYIDLKYVHLKYWAWTIFCNELCVPKPKWPSCIIFRILLSLLGIIILVPFSTKSSPTVSSS